MNCSLQDAHEQITAPLKSNFGVVHVSYQTVFTDHHSNIHEFFTMAFKKFFTECLHCIHEVSTAAFRRFSLFVVIASGTLCLDGPDRPLSHSVSDGVLHVILQNRPPPRQNRQGSILQYIGHSNSNRANYGKYFLLCSRYMFLTDMELCLGTL